MSTTKVGKYVVRAGLRPDNPAFPVYLVFHLDELIGKCFSMPDEGACQWLEVQQREQTMYAYKERRCDLSVHQRSKGRRSRPSIPERDQRAALTVNVEHEEAI